ncbi:MAG: preprotein translocase subunit SecG [Treponema sp.]|nr:preprotein translocase subunit SecG [Treponema sp.]
MTILSTVLLVFFVINAVLLVLLVLVQNDEGGGLGGMFGGGANTAFGSRSGNVLTRATTVLGSLFLIISLSLAFLSRTGTTNVEAEGLILSNQEAGFNWVEDELNPRPQSDTPNLQDITFDDLFNEDFFNENFMNNENTPENQ